jgi:hypothetical protein
VLGVVLGVVPLEHLLPQALGFDQDDAVDAAVADVDGVPGAAAVAGLGVGAAADPAAAHELGGGALDDLGDRLGAGGLLVAAVLVSVLEEQADRVVGQRAGELFADGQGGGHAASPLRVSSQGGREMRATSST